MRCIFAVQNFLSPVGTNYVSWQSCSPLGVVCGCYCAAVNSIFHSIFLRNFCPVIEPQIIKRSCSFSFFLPEQNIISYSASPRIANKAPSPFLSFLIPKGLKSPKRCWHDFTQSDVNSPQGLKPRTVCSIRAGPVLSEAFAFSIFFAASPCELYCRPLNEQFSEKMLDAVADGTPCYEGNKSRDICINGICKVSPRQLLINVA